MKTTMKNLYETPVSEEIRMTVSDMLLTSVPSGVTSVPPGGSETPEEYEE